MCLVISNRVKVTFDSKGWLVAYKVIGKDNHPAHYSYRSVYKRGVNKSNRQSQTLNAYDDGDWAVEREINRGIHVFLNLDDALKIARNDTWRKVIEVRCHKKHLVGVGYGPYKIKRKKSQNAVFMQVTVKSLKDIRKKETSACA